MATNIFKTCKTCQFRHQAQGGQLECVANPPAVFPMPQGPGRIGFISAYPPITDNHPACRHHRIAVHMEIPNAQGAKSS